MSKCEHKWDDDGFCEHCGVHYTIGEATAYRLVKKGGELVLQGFYRSEGWCYGWRDVPTIEVEQEKE